VQYFNANWNIYGFGGYAARFWTDHVRDVENDLVQGMDDLSNFKFLASKTKRDLILKLTLWRPSTILHIAAKTGLAAFYSLCLDAKVRYVLTNNLN